MDLRLIARKIWRHKLITVPVILLMLAAATYVITVKQAPYEASSTYLMIRPPAPPTAEQIAHHPELGEVKADNPYIRFADLSVVSEVLMARMSAESVRGMLAKANADPRYTLGSATEFGASAPMIQVKALASTPEGAMRSAEVVGHALVGELDRMQARDVDRAYRITAVQVVTPDGARRKTSGPLRTLVGVLGFGPRTEARAFAPSYVASTYAAPGRGLTIRICALRANKRGVPRSGGGSCHRALLLGIRAS
jgi:hypothetical protein